MSLTNRNAAALDHGALYLEAFLGLPDKRQVVVIFRRLLYKAPPFIPYQSNPDTLKKPSLFIGDLNCKQCDLMARFNILTFTKYDNLHISIKTEWVQNSIFQIGTILPNLVTILDEKNQLLIFGRNESLNYSYPSNENKGKMILVLPTLTFQF